MPVADRIMARALKAFEARRPTGSPDECWLWTGAKAGAGYGYVSVRHDGKRTNFYTHRLACILETGEEGEVALHTCDTPACCNPAHIRWGSRSENTRDMVDKRREGQQMRVNPRRTLTWEQAEAIRNADGTYREIAARFGVHHSQVGGIKNGKLYRRKA